MDLNDKCSELRRTVLDMCAKAGTGHVTSSFSCVEILTVLYYAVMRKEDKFVLSKAQASPILYSILADKGNFPKEDLKTFCQKNGKMGVHLQHSVTGTYLTAGSLGHGFGVAAGMALAEKKNRGKGLVFTLLGDGELYEGSIWETAMFAGHNRLNNLIAIVDRNFISATNFTEDALSLEPLEDKFAAFGWNVLTIDGHSTGELLAFLDRVHSHQTPKPFCIIAETVKGKGFQPIEDDPAWHARAVTGENYKEARRVL